VVTSLLARERYGLSMARPGDLDTTFSGDGKRAIDFGGQNESIFGAALQPDGVAVFGHAVARQPNGRIVVVGQRSGGDDFAVARLLG
jgi:hypothetical protein